MNRDKRTEIFRRLAEHIEKPETELNYSSAFETADRRDSVRAGH